MAARLDVRLTQVAAVFFASRNISGEEALRVDVASTTLKKGHRYG